jgi:hypothetical protein
MSQFKVQLNTNDLILFHLVQRLVYQYHTLFSERKNHPTTVELTKLWFDKIFFTNPYFQNMPNTYLLDFEIRENKDLLIVFRGPLTYRTFYLSLDKDISECITYVDNESKFENINIFNIEYAL